MPFVAIDLETTGLDNRKDKIIEVAMVKFDEKTFEIIETFSSLINPGIHIPELNANITGIVDEMVNSAPFFEQLQETISDFIKDYPILGHNVQFDRRFLISNGIKIDKNQFIDTFFLANAFLFKESSISLDSLSFHFSIPLKEAHRALHDTIATVGVFEKLVSHFHTNLSEEEKEIFHFVLSGSNDEQVVFLKEYLFGNIPRARFEKIKGIILKKIGFYQFEETKKEKKVQSIKNYLKKIPGIESRENQIALLDLIDKNFHQKQKSVIEAPTGIGKTLAYLLPSVKYSMETGEQVFISTKSKILQDQLYLKDLKTLHTAIGGKFSYVKIKGQENYISLLAFFQHLSENQMEYDTVSFMSKITLWLYKTTDGELDELNYYGEEVNFVKLVYSSLEDAFADTNPYKEYEFLYKSRRSLETANIVVINHAILFSESKMKGEIYKAIHNLVIDEAHNIEDVATSSLKRRYNAKETRYFFKDFLNKARKSNFSQIAELEIQSENLFLLLDVLGDFLTNYFVAKGGGGNDFQSFLVKDEAFFEEKIINLSIQIQDDLGEIMNILKASNQFTKEMYILQEISSVFEVVFTKSHKDEFIQIASYHPVAGITLEYTTLDVGSFCTENIWSKVKNLFLVSATLKIGENFDFFKRTLGLHTGIEFYSFESDFDYATQAELILVQDLGSIKNNFRGMAYFLKALLLLLKGNTLVLFTSFSLIRSTYLELNAPLKEKGTILLAQGVFGSKYRILDKFKEKSNNHIIFGTDSFWEGIDIPGEDLKYLIIHKFPFSVPTDPVFLARSVLYADPFKEYAIPKAIIKLKQGMGRLIRTKTDFGKIILLDDRIFSTQWGENFYLSFPKNIKISHLSTQQVLSNID